MQFDWPGGSGDGVGKPSPSEDVVRAQTRPADDGARLPDTGIAQPAEAGLAEHAGKLVTKELRCTLGLGANRPGCLPEGDRVERGGLMRRIEDGKTARW